MPRDARKALATAPRNVRLQKAPNPGGSVQGEPVVSADGATATVLRGVAVCTRGEALGHGLWLDDAFLASVAAGVTAAGDQGVKSRFTHPGLSSDGLGKYMGRLRNSSVAGGVVRGDLTISPLASEAPDGDLGGYVVKLAAADPAAFGLSIVFERDREAEAALMLAHGGRWVETEFGREIVGFESPDKDNRENYPHARLKALLAADVVDDPAANPSGLFHRGQDVPAEAEALLAYAVGLSEATPTVALDFHPDRARRFVQGFMARHGLKLTKAKETAMGCDCGGKCGKCKKGAAASAGKPLGMLAKARAALAAVGIKLGKSRFAGEEPVPQAENPDGSTPPAPETTEPTLECGCFMVDSEGTIVGKVDADNGGADPEQETDEEPKEGMGTKRTAAELGRFMDAFGDAQGAKWFREGKSFEAATAAFLKGNREETERLQKENAKLTARVVAARGAEPLELGAAEEGDVRAKARAKLAASPINRIAAGIKFAGKAN